MKKNITLFFIVFIAYSSEAQTTVESIAQNMVLVNGGTLSFLPAGTNSVKSLKIGSFHISKYEVTQAQYKAVMGKNPSCNARAKNVGSRPLINTAFEISCHNKSSKV